MWPTREAGIGLAPTSTAPSAASRCCADSRWLHEARCAEAETEVGGDVRLGDVGTERWGWLHEAAPPVPKPRRTCSALRPGRGLGAPNWPEWGKPTAAPCPGGRSSRPQGATSQPSPRPPPSLPRVPGGHPVGRPGARPGLPRRGGGLRGVLTSAFDPALAHANDCQHQTGCEGGENYPLKRDGLIPISSQGIADLRIFHYPKCCAVHTKQPPLRRS